MQSINTREDLENIEELASLHNQVEELRLQDKLSEQNFHENIKKLYEPLTDKIKVTSRDITKTVAETCLENN